MQIKTDTMDELWHTANKTILLARTPHLAHWHGLTTVVNENLLRCNSMEWSLDLGTDLWLTRSRFTKLQRDYLYWPEVEGFIQRATKIQTMNRGVVTQLICRNHGAKDHPVAQSYQWGNCLLAFTFRGGKKNRPTIGLHSRVSYISYMGGLDLSLAYVLGTYIAEQTGIAIEDFAFCWYSDVLQMQTMKSVAYYHRFGLMEDYIDNLSLSHDDRPTLRLSRSIMHRLRKKHEHGPGWETEKFGPLKRLRQRYEHYIDTGETKPSCPVDTLNLDGIRLLERSN